MARNIAPCPDIPSKCNPWKEYERMELTVQVVTPMFGGGVEAGEKDPITPIRVSSIRGHLRFWWRATYGAAFDSIDEMRLREVEVWGDTENPSPVIAKVTAQPEINTKREPNNYGFSSYGPEAYALLSAKQNAKSIIQEGISFSLLLCWPTQKLLQDHRDRENAKRKQRKMVLLDPMINDITPDVNSAVWAWLQYGGLGARSRRGCGALRLMEAKPVISTPGLTQSEIVVYLGEKTQDALESWRAAVRVYQNFRQSFRGPKHNKTRNGKVLRNIPGRSKWPEPDSIRKLTGCALSRQGAPSDVSDDVNTHDHTRPVVSESTIPGFPRAILGLPIVFHFADGPSKGQPSVKNLDPQDVEIVPEFPDIHDKEGRSVVGKRMASPIITRPMFVQGQWRPAIVFLPRPACLNARLIGKSAKFDRGRSLDLDVAIHRSQIENEALKGLKPLCGENNAFDALKQFVQEQGFQEVKL